MTAALRYISRWMSGTIKYQALAAWRRIIRHASGCTIRRT